MKLFEQSYTVQENILEFLKTKTSISFENNFAKSVDDIQDITDKLHTDKYMFLFLLPNAL